MNTRRQGAMLLELIVSITILGTVIITIVPLLTAVGHQRRAADHRQLAQQLAANTMEQISLFDWDGITAESLEALSKPSALQSLRDGGLSVQVDTPSEPTDVKVVKVEVHYKNRAGEPASPVRLVAWFHRQRTNG